jgi:hypothetical protein
MTRDERHAYFRAIIESIHGKPPEDAHEVTSADFGILQEWADREIPLAWILQAIEEMGNARSVRHARPAVEQEIERCLNAEVL